MDDPWDVKSVRHAGQYTSCMKINGIPLLPPVLSKECRKEMQYYKLLAKEVEKRISILQPYIEETDSESVEDRADAPEISECEPYRQITGDIIESPLRLTETATSSPKQYKNYNTSHQDSAIDSSNFVVDFSLHINQTNIRNVERQRTPSPPLELPERDYNCINKTKELLLDTETTKRNGVDLKFNKDELSDPFVSLNRDEPHSISSKSFTGSLNDLYTDSVKEQCSKLVRQRSYTLLKPSPQLLAHLEVQSLNTGVEMSCISMSESLSNLSSPNKKRRSWDLESAKVKWSSMALELRQKNLSKTNTPIRRQPTRSAIKKTPHSSPQRASSAVADKRRTPASKTPKSEPIQKAKPNPVRNSPLKRPFVKEQSPKTKEESPPSPKSPKALVSESEDPATRVRELYEKIQKQQLIQMASLVEKQKREQLLLQQVFEEQNNLLYKQLKTICPKSPIEVKEAWSDKQARQQPDRGPVSLSQLINYKQDSIIDSSIHTDTKNKIIRNTKTNGVPTEGNRTRTHSPQRNTSRRLNYDTSSEYEPMLTDRTNDTMADLNVTFPSDSDDPRLDVSHRKDVTVIHASPVDCRAASTESAIRCMERSIHNSINSSRRGRSSLMMGEPTPEQRSAATKIVAHARGYLIRRLFRTERVQTTVQTIKDALLCALQLHQDREGIRGADVDLHRRLIQQITAACYSLHDTFIASTAAERCAMIAADRSRRRSLAAKLPPRATTRDVMSQSHCGSFPARPKKVSSSLMTQSSYESYSGEKMRARYMPSPRRRPWR